MTDAERIRAFIRTSEGSRLEVHQALDSLLAEIARLEAALREIADWDAEAAARHGDVGVREFAREALGSRREDD